MGRWWSHLVWVSQTWCPPRRHTMHLDTHHALVTMSGGRETVLNMGVVSWNPVGLIPQS